MIPILVLSFGFLVTTHALTYWMVLPMAVFCNAAAFCAQILLMNKEKLQLPQLAMAARNVHVLAQLPDYQKLICFVVALLRMPFGWAIQRAICTHIGNLLIFITFSYFFTLVLHFQHTELLTHFFLYAGYSN